MRASNEIAVAPKHATATRVACSAASVKIEHCRVVGGANIDDCGWGGVGAGRARAGRALKSAVPILPSSNWACSGWRGLTSWRTATWRIACHACSSASCQSIRPTSWSVACDTTLAAAAALLLPPPPPPPPLPPRNSTSKLVATSVWSRVHSACSWGGSTDRITCGVAVARIAHMAGHREGGLMGAGEPLGRGGRAHG